MTIPLPFTLRLALRAVPAPQRAEWLRFWQAELWHAAHTSAPAPRLAAGLLRDALWLRLEAHRTALRGTAPLALATLTALCLAALLVALAFAGRWSALLPSLSFAASAALIAAPLVLFVHAATAPARPVHHHASQVARPRLRPLLYAIARTILLLLLAALFSTASCQPLHHVLPATADYLQVFLFVFASLAGLRWGAADQRNRCAHCLTLLQEPAYFGPPSHTLLAWSGTRLACRHGHGLLAIPALETSWCRTSEWRPHPIL